MFTEETLPKPIRILDSNGPIPEDELDYYRSIPIRCPITLPKAKLEQVYSVDRRRPHMCRAGDWLMPERLEHRNDCN